MRVSSTTYVPLIYFFIPYDSCTTLSTILQLLTFLIAGHETTSGMLTFATYYLLKNPSALRALREELDSVVGVGGDVQLEHLGRLPYLVGTYLPSLPLENNN